LPNVGPYIYDVSISGFTRSSIYIYDISSLRVNIRLTKKTRLYQLPLPLRASPRKTVTLGYAFIKTVTSLSFSTLGLLYVKYGSQYKYENCGTWGPYSLVDIHQHFEGTCCLNRLLRKRRKVTPKRWREIN